MQESEARAAYDVANGVAHVFQMLKNANFKKIVTLKDNYSKIFSYLYIDKTTILWQKATILSVEQTEKAGLFTIIFESEAISEFNDFINKFINDAERSTDLQQILTQIDLMLNERGFTERNFRYEGKMSDNVVALPTYKNTLRLYCLRLSDSVLIVGNGGIKTTQKVAQDPILNGYVINLQKLDALLKADIKRGLVRIEKTEIFGANNKEYDI